MDSVTNEDQPTQPKGSGKTEPQLPSTPPPAHLVREWGSAEAVPSFGPVYLSKQQIAGMARIIGPAVERSLAKRRAQAAGEQK